MRAMTMTEIALEPEDIKQRKINLDTFFSTLEDEQSQSLRNSLIKYLDFIESQIGKNKESQE